MNSKENYPSQGKYIPHFKPNSFRDVRNLYQDKASMDMTLNEIKYLSNNSWDKKYLPLTIDMTNVEYTRRY